MNTAGASCAEGSPIQRGPSTIRIPVLGVRRSGLPNSPSELRAFFDSIDAAELLRMQSRHDEENYHLDFKRMSVRRSPSSTLSDTPVNSVRAPKCFEMSRAVMTAAIGPEDHGGSRARENRITPRPTPVPAEHTNGAGGNRTPVPRPSACRLYACVG